MKTNVSARNRVLFAELEKIRKDSGGTLRPVDVVEAARDVKSPLHTRFCWDDTEAAHKYRLVQARQLITEITVITTVKHEPVPAYISITVDRRQPGGTIGYRAMSDVVRNKILRRQMVADALNELQVVEKKYQQIQELARIFKSQPWIEVMGAVTKAKSAAAESEE